MGDGRIDVQARSGGADQAELAGAGQVGANHFGQGAAMGVVHREIGDGNGYWVAPVPEMSTRSWAWAGLRAIRQASASSNRPNPYDRQRTRGKLVGYGRES